MEAWIKDMRKRLGTNITIYDEFRWIVKHTVRINPKARITLLKKIDELQSANKCDDPIIDDGFGNVYSKRCPICNKLTMVIIRPGSAACSNPDCDNN